MSVPDSNSHPWNSPIPGFSPLSWTTASSFGDITMETDATITTTPGGTSVDGVGVLTYQRAIDIARNSEGELDSGIRDYLERAVSDIWSRIIAAPDSYLMTKDEFAVFNFFIRRFEGLEIAEHAIDRYWRHTHHSDGTDSAA